MTPDSINTECLLIAVADIGIEKLPRPSKADGVLLEFPRRLWSFRNAVGVSHSR